MNSIAFNSSHFFEKIKKWFRSHKTETLIVALMIGLAAARLVLSYYRGAVYNIDGPHDDRLMLEYSDFAAHFSSEGEKTLVKYMGFPWFLNLLSKLGLSVRMGIGICWILAALCAYLAVRQISGRGWSVFSYAFVLFSPQGYIYTGIRLYRNMLIAPVFYMLFGLMLAVFLICWKNRGKYRFIWIVLLSCLISFVYPLAYFIKEDSSWMKPVMLLFIIGSAAGLVWWMIKRRSANRMMIIVSILSLLFPLVQFHFESRHYIQANEKYFGISDYTLRTNGELAGFIDRVYTIESDQRNIHTWAPYDALERAFEASPTLQSDPEMRELVFHSAWAADGNEDIRGDFLSWVLMTAVYTDASLGNARSADSYFKKVNEELDQAFKNGSLKKDSRIQLTKSSAGRTVSEIREIFPQLLMFIENELFLNYEEIGPVMPVEYNEELKYYEEKLHQPLMIPQDESLKNKMLEEAQTGADAANGLIALYRILNPVLLIAGILSWFITIILAFRKKIVIKSVTITQLAAVFILTGLSLGYAVGIIWFSAFIYYGSSVPMDMMFPLKLYGTGSAVMLYLAVLTAIPLWKRLIQYYSGSLQKK